MRGELDVGRGSPGGSRLGVRHEIGAGARTVRVEWGVERLDLRADAADISWMVAVSGRF